MKVWRNQGFGHHYLCRLRGLEAQKVRTDVEEQIQRQFFENGTSFVIFVEGVFDCSDPFARLFTRYFQGLDDTCIKRVFLLKFGNFHMLQKLHIVDFGSSEKRSRAQVVIDGALRALKIMQIRYRFIDFTKIIDLTF